MGILRKFGVLCGLIAGLFLSLDKLAILIIPGKDIGFESVPGRDATGPFLRLIKGVGDVECWVRLTSPGWDPNRHLFSATMGSGTPVGVRWETGSLIVSDPSSPNGKRQFTWYAGEEITIRLTSGPPREFEVADWEVHLKDGPPETRTNRRNRIIIQCLLVGLLALGLVAGLLEAFDKLAPRGVSTDPVLLVRAVIAEVRAEESESHLHTKAYRKYLDEMVVKKRTDGMKVMAALLPRESPGVQYLARLGAIGDFKKRLDDLLSELQVFRTRAT
jgi:hypothetical protein